MILGVIPVRGGSKGIPRKNIKAIAGKPLLAWTIELAKKSKIIDKLVVSTENNEIAKVARKYGVEVLRRPRSLAGDAISTISVLKHVVDRIPCKVVVLLQATSPIRSGGLIDECINEFLEKDYDSLATGFICNYKEYGKNKLRRQDIKGFFYDDGNVYVVKSSFIKKGDRYGRKIGRKIVSRWENIEIDDEFDFWVAEQALLKRKVR